MNAPPLTRRSLTGHAIAACAMVLAACDDPSLRIVVEHPASASELAALVRRVEISVYERDGLTCDDIAFRKLSDEELAAMLRSKGEGALTQIPRLGHKAVVARAYGPVDSREDRLLLAGCTEVDEIAADERVVIATEPAAIAALDSSQIAISGAVEIAVVAVDARGRGLDGKLMTWTTYGPALQSGNDVLEPSAPLALQQGERVFRPTLPTMVGPYAVQVRVKWATNLPPLVTSALTNPPITRTLSTAATFLNTCAIYLRQGQPTLACLEEGPPRMVRSYRLTGNQLVALGLPQAPATDAVAVLGVGNDALLVNSNGTYASAFGGGLSGSICNGTCAPGVTVLDVLGFPGCGNGAASPGLFAYYREGALPKLTGTVLSDGRKVSFLPPVEPATLGAIGCVTDLATNGATQVAASVSTATSSQLYLFVTDRPIERRRERRLAGTGFAPSSTDAREARVLTTEIDATGFVVVESVLARPGLAYRLVERRRSAAVSPPLHYVSGSFDADGEVDLAWDVRDELGTALGGVQVLLGARPGRPSLSGRIPLDATSDLLAADLDGDGLAELIGYSGTTVSVQRMGSL